MELWGFTEEEASRVLQIERQKIDEKEAKKVARAAIQKAGRELASKGTIEIEGKTYTIAELAAM